MELLQISLHRSIILRNSNSLGNEEKKNDKSQLCGCVVDMNHQHKIIINSL